MSDPMEKWRASLPPVIQLRASSQLPEVIRLLAGRRLRAGDRRSTQQIVEIAALNGMKGPDYSGRLTATERREKAKRIIDAATRLRAEIAPLLGDDYADPFQPIFDGLALDVAADYLEKRGLSEADFEDEFAYEDAVNAARWPVYHALFHAIPETLDAICEATEWWSERRTVLSKPNHPNAARLYFIRVVTRHFCLAFGSPMRAATLALTSVYFETDDLQEADLSRLAPVHAKG